MQSKDRTYQVIAIVALVIGVCALTVGFAAFSTNLTINSAADVRPASSVLDVVFSTSNSSVVSGNVTATLTNTAATAPTADDAVLTNTTVTGLNAHFTEPGQKVTYSFNVYNNSAFTGYLTGIAFNNASGGSAFKACNTTGTTNPATTGVDAACADITLKLTVEDKVTNATESKAANQINDTTGLAASTGKAVTVEIEYPAGSDTADGEFNVVFGDIVLTYSSVSGV